MLGSRTHECKHPAKAERIGIYGVFEREVSLDDIDKYPEQGGKWDRHFWATGYHVTTIGNVTDSAIQEYIREQEEKDRQEDRTLR